jgi:hypothetical protein
MDEVTKVQMASNDEGKSTNPYIVQHIPSGIIQQLEAGAFRSLVSHLQDRSDQVQNIDLMTVSGFCRNCLAKVGQGQGTGQGLYLGKSLECVHFQGSFLLPDKFISQPSFQCYISFFF